jgi:hypothetical protein
MLGEKGLYVFGLMSREIVEHDVNLLRPTGALDQTVRKETNSLLVWRPAVMPRTFPVFICSAA